MSPIDPAPDLQELVRRRDGYDKVPSEAWAEHDRAMQQWQKQRRLGLAAKPSLADLHKICGILRRQQ